MCFVVVGGMIHRYLPHSRRQQIGNHVAEGGFAAAGGADYAKKLTFLDIEVELIEDHKVDEVLA